MAPRRPGPVPRTAGFHEAGTSGGTPLPARAVGGPGWVSRVPLPPVQAAAKDPLWRPTAPAPRPRHGPTGNAWPDPWLSSEEAPALVVQGPPRTPEPHREVRDHAHTACGQRYRTQGSQMEPGRSAA